LKDAKQIEFFEKRVVGYLDRIKYLKGHLDSSSRASGAGGAATAKPGDKSSEESSDAESDRLKGALSGAIVSTKPNIKWSDVAGLAGAKTALKEAVILPQRFPELYAGKRSPIKGILLYGPPGTGKSYLAKAVATEADSKFFSISSSDVMSKWQGESERLVRTLFKMARDNKPAIIFIDEIDSMCGARGDGQSESSRRVMTEFLVQMQGVGKGEDGVLVLGATNIPWGIDSAMRRRFEKRVYIALPDVDARRAMFKIHIGDTENDLRPMDREVLAIMSEGMSGSDISVVVREALRMPIRKCQEATHFIKRGDDKHLPVPPGTPGAVAMTIMDVPRGMLAVPCVTMEDFAYVMKRAKASVGTEELAQYNEWTRDFGEEGA
jgi:vacuolar protein-sorting-associated protein 4